MAQIREFLEENPDMTLPTLAEFRQLLHTLPQVDSTALDGTLHYVNHERFQSYRNDSGVYIREVLHLLLDKGADPGQIKDLYSFAAITDFPLFEKCIQRGMSIDAQDGKDRPRSTLIRQIMSIWILMIRENAEQEREIFPVREIAQMRQILEWILAHDVDLSLSDAKGLLPIHDVCNGMIYNEDTMPIVMEIIQRSDVNALDNSGNTPLHYLPWEGESPFSQRTLQEIAQLLIRAGANPMLRNEHGNTPSDIALDNDQEELAGFLLQKEREFQEQAQGALVVRTRNRQGAQVFPTAIAKRITNFLGGRTRKRKGKGKGKTRHKKNGPRRTRH